MCCSTGDNRCIHVLESRRACTCADDKRDGGGGGGLQRVAHLVEVDSQLVARVRTDDVLLRQLLGHLLCELEREPPALVDGRQFAQLALLCLGPWSGAQRVTAVDVSGK
jgi:hypothetical protein